VTAGIDDPEPDEAPAGDSEPDGEPSAGDENAAEPEAVSEHAAAAPEKPPAVPTWLSRNGRKLVVASSVATFVAAGAFAGAALQPYLADRAAVAVKLKIAQRAADAITTLWSYTPDDMDRLSDRASKYLGGDFAEQYRAYVDTIAPTNKQAQVSSSTTVVGAGVESLRGDEASAIVYTNTTSTTPRNNNIPSMQYLSYRLELKRYDRDWRVTKMTTVTSLDLTPQL
jgi:Mce-associated membrane protein